MYSDVIRFIDLFHPKEQPNLSVFNSYIFTKGQCFRFAQILATTFQHNGAKIVGTGTICGGTPYGAFRKEVLNGTYNHYFTRIDDCYYDINGCAGECAADLDVDEEILDPNEFLSENGRDIPWLSKYLDENQIFNVDVKFIRTLSQKEIDSVESITCEYYHNEFMEKTLDTVILQFAEDMYSRCQQVKG